MSALIPLPNVKHILIAWLCGAMCASFATHQVMRWRADSAQLANVKVEQKQVVQEQVRRSSIAKNFEGDRRGIDHYFEAQRAEYQSWLGQQPDAANCNLDADGLRIWNAANAGPTGDGSSAISAVQLGAAEGDERRVTSAVAQPSGSHAEVSPAVRANERAD